MTLIEDGPTTAVESGEQASGTELAADLAASVGIEPSTEEPKRDLFKELRAMRRDDGIHDGAQVVTVHETDAYQLPPSTEPKPSAEAQTLDRIRSDIEDQTPRVEPIVSAAERYMRQPNMPAPESAADSAEGFRMALSGARTVEELREKARPYIATRQEASLSGPAKVQGLIVESPDGWFKPVSGNAEAAVFMTELERARQSLEKRGAVEKAKDRVGRAFDLTRTTAGEVRQVVRDHEQFAHEQRQRLAEERERQREAAEARIIRRKDEERAQEDERREMDRNAEEMLRESRSFEDYVREKQTEARQPFDIQIARLERRKLALGGLGADTFRDMKRNALIIDREITGLRKQAQTASLEARKAALKERAEIVKETNEQADAVLDLLESTEPGQHIYKPAVDQDPERSVSIAATNSELVGKMSPPAQVDEYKLGDTRMQRLVFLTARTGVVVVEDWDKTAGVLKRQSIIKGDNLMIHEHQNAGHGVIRRNLGRNNDKYVLSNDVYKNLGPFITTDEVAADADTSYQKGSFSYAKRMVRSGVGAGKAYELSSGAYKPKKHNSESFIKMITKGFEKAVKTK